MMGPDEGLDHGARGPVANKGRDAMETFESSDGTVIAFERSGRVAP
jgi:hypothetical protein